MNKHLPENYERFEPLENWVLIELDDDWKPEISEGGIYIPDKVDIGGKQAVRGIVRAVGPGYTDKDEKYHGVYVKVGDRILCTNYAATTIQKVPTTGQAKWRLIECDDILALVDNG